MCAAWNGDFLDTLTTLVDEFNMRFDAHKAYKSQRKTAAQVLAEEQEAAAAEEEARKLQEKVSTCLQSRCMQQARVSLCMHGDASRISVRVLR